MKKLNENYDVVVVGGGISGMCAAIAAARHGAKTALIQNRSVLGGNASSEIRMHICGADNHAKKPNLRETGIIEEFLLKNKERNPNHSWPIFDSVLWESCNFEKNLTLFLNLHIDSVVCEDNVIKSVSGVQQTSERYYTFTAKQFIDCTGDGTLGALAGAEFMYGREAKTDFNEADAENVADEYTMGNSIMFQAKDIGKPVKFVKPEWAYSYSEDDLNFRDHGDVNSGYWWIELGGRDLHTIDDAEELRDELYKTVYGIWDHIKNNGDHGAENFELDWVGVIPGKRESRRLTGDYVLTQQDCLENRYFEDTVAYGGWPLDCHVIDGFRSNSNEPTRYFYIPDSFNIPYRCLYSKNIDNLFLGGRAISATHMAFASTRVMGTCAVVGQAVGTAAAFGIENNLNPREVGESIKTLQQMLIKDDCYLPGFKNEDEQDKTRFAKLSASSQREGFEVQKLVDGYHRNTTQGNHCFVSNGVAKEGEFVEIDFEKLESLSEVQIRFDSDLSKEIMITIIKWARENQVETLPASLVKDFEVTYYKNGEIVKTVKVCNNNQRFVKIKTDNTECDKVRVTAFSTYGDEDIRIFEIRAY